MLIMSICEQLRINETFFDGYELPETVEDVLIFFSTEIEDQNNIPEHIKKLLDKHRENPEMTDEELIRECDIIWFSCSIAHYVNSAVNNENPKLANFYSIFKFCIENYNIYSSNRTQMKRLITICQQKINEVLDAVFKKHVFNINKNHPCYRIYQKCHELQDLHIRDHLVDETMISYRRGDEMMG